MPVTPECSFTEPTLAIQPAEMFGEPLRWTSSTFIPLSRRISCTGTRCAQAAENSIHIRSVRYMIAYSSVLKRSLDRLFFSLLFGQRFRSIEGDGSLGAELAVEVELHNIPGEQPVVAHAYLRFDRKQVSLLADPGVVVIEGAGDPLNRECRRDILAFLRYFEDHFRVTVHINQSRISHGRFLGPHVIDGEFGVR